MIRQIILDTETTGLEWQNGDRLIEIGCVELVGRKRTGRGRSVAGGIDLHDRQRLTVRLCRRDRYDIAAVRRDQG